MIVMVALLSDYALRSPGGHRVRLYKRCQLDMFAEYLLPDGLVRRLTEFEDTHSLYIVLRSLVNPFKPCSDANWLYFKCVHWSNPLFLIFLTFRHSGAQP